MHVLNLTKEQFIAHLYA